jgi:hypothetical protein
MLLGNLPYLRPLQLVQLGGVLKNAGLFGGFAKKEFPYETTTPDSQYAPWSYVKTFKQVWVVKYS